MRNVAAALFVLAYLLNGSVAVEASSDCYHTEWCQDVGDGNGFYWWEDGCTWEYEAPHCDYWFSGAQSYCAGWPYYGYVSEFQCFDDWPPDTSQCWAYPGYCYSSGYFKCYAVADYCQP